MKTLVVTLCSLAVLLLATGAWAQDDPCTKCKTTDDRCTSRATKVYDACVAKADKAKGAAEKKAVDPEKANGAYEKAKGACDKAKTKAEERCTQANAACTKACEKKKASSAK